MKHNGPYARPPADRFHEKWTLSPTGCWIWLASNHKFGYGKIGTGSAKDGTKTVRCAHKVSWEIHRGPVPDGLHVCHECDVPQCVNPHHLFLDTNLGNNRDKQIKGRAARKLTPDQVATIRARRATGETLVSIAKDFGIHHTMVSFIARGVAWNHV